MRKAGRADDGSVVTVAKQPSEISASTVFRTRSVPDLGLEARASYPLRVYVLRCRGGCTYVGISPKGVVRERIAKQFAGEGSHFCDVNRPIDILMTWPAASAATEAAVFFGMQEHLGLSDYRKLGGWTQTSANPSPLVVMQMTQSGRQLQNRCFNCGRSHHAKYKDCPGSNLDCSYTCMVCKAKNNISSRGQSSIDASVAAAAKAASDAAAARATATRPPPKAAAPKAVAAPSTTRVTTAAAPVVIASSSGRKRQARQAFSHAVCPMTFSECWESPKVRRCGRYRSTKDFLKVMDAIWAGRAQPTVGQRVRDLAVRNGWPDGAYDDFEEFGASSGGGRSGVGCTIVAARDVYAKFAKR